MLKSMSPEGADHGPSVPGHILCINLVEHQYMLFGQLLVLQPSLPCHHYLGFAFPCRVCVCGAKEARGQPRGQRQKPRSVHLRHRQAGSGI
jgi:hypothetical protein